eukprot:15432342-Alexandrium_andersonii.AAC.1
MLGSRAKAPRRHGLLWRPPSKARATMGILQRSQPLTYTKLLIKSTEVSCMAPLQQQAPPPGFWLPIPPISRPLRPSASLLGAV